MMLTTPTCDAATRFLAGVGLAVLVSACEQSRPLPPTSPSGTTVPPATNGGPFIASGIVYEVTAGGLHPLAGVGIDASADYQSFLPQVASDADGRYEVRLGAVRSESVILKLVGVKTGYSQPCRVPITPTANVVRDLYLVSDATLSSTGVPASMPIAPQTLSGVVFERTPAGDRPVAGASVTGDFSSGLGWGPSAQTRSDAEGHYFLCGISQSELGLSLYVTKPGYQAAWVVVDRRGGGSIDLNLGGNLDVELKR